MSPSSKMGAHWAQYSRRQLAALQTAATDGWVSRLGLRLDDEGRFLLPFFNRLYEAAPAGLAPLDGGEVSLDHLGVMAHYLCSGGRGDLVGEFVPLRLLTGLVESQMPSADSRTRPLLEFFGNDGLRLAEAAERFGGRLEGPAPSGARAWIFSALPKVPLQLLFFEEDEEFPAEAKLLFDRSAIRYVTYEVLEMLEFILVDGLIS